MKKTFSDIFDQGISPLTKIGKYALEFHNHSVIEKKPQRKYFECHTSNWRDARAQFKIKKKI